MAGTWLDVGARLEALHLRQPLLDSVRALLVVTWGHGWDAGKAAGIAEANAAHQAADDTAEHDRAAAWTVAARTIPTQPFSALAELRGEPERAAVARRHEARVWSGWGTR